MEKAKWYMSDKFVLSDLGAVIPEWVPFQEKGEHKIGKENI